MMARLALTGDILPVRPGFAQSASPSAGFRRLVALLRESDVSIGNFEMPLTDRGEPREKLMTIRADPVVGAGLSALGLDVATVANNHSYDYGWEGLQDTIDALARAGTQCIGAGQTLSEAARPAVVDLPGCRVGVLAFTCLIPTGAAAAEGRRGLSPIHVETSYEIDPYYQMEEPGDPSVVTIRTRVRPDDLEFATSLVSRWRDEVDLLVASVHWGFGSGEQLADYQQPLGRALIEAGADVIHGHHPHAIHAVELYRGKPILYGLGTFVGQQTFLDASPAVKRMWAEMSPDGLIALIDVDGDDLSVRGLPTSLSVDRLAEPAEGEALTRIRERLCRLSGRHATEVVTAGSELLFMHGGSAHEARSRKSNGR